MSAGASYAHITSTSTDGVVSAVPCTVHGVAINTAASGQTLKLYDVAAEADVAAGNLVASVALDTVGSGPLFGPGIAFRKGLVAVLSAGAPDLTVIWG